MTSVTVSMRELRNSTADVIRKLEAGFEVTLTNRGTPVARITPIDPPSPGRRLLDSLDSLGAMDTGLAHDIATWRSAEADAETTSA